VGAEHHCLGLRERRRDNTLWTFGGPLLGWRFYVTGGPTVDFLDRGFDSTILQFDVRHYIKLGSRAAIALRYVTRNAWGGDDLLFYMGGLDVARHPYKSSSDVRCSCSTRRFRLDGPRIDSCSVNEFPMFRARCSSTPGAPAATYSPFSTRTGWERSASAPSSTSASRPCCESTLLGPRISIR
jgi:hypothetical protein